MKIHNILSTNRLVYKLPYFGFIFMLLLSVSCSKDDEGNKIDSGTAIIGNWKLKKITTTATNKDIVLQIKVANILYENNELLEEYTFNKDNTGEQKKITTKGGTQLIEKITWKIVNNDIEITFTKSNTALKAKISSINNKTLVLDLKLRLLSNNTLYPAQYHYDKK